MGSAQVAWYSNHVPHSFRQAPEPGRAAPSHNGRLATVGPGVVATLHFLGPEAVPERRDAASTVSRDTVRLLAELFQLEAQLAGVSTPVTAALREDGFWESGFGVIARHLNEYFGGEARYAAFPRLSSQPLETVAAAVADLFGARLTWARDLRDDPRPSRRR